MTDTVREPVAPGACAARIQSVKALTRATKLDPKNAQYFSNLGEIERQRGKTHEAAAALNEALHLNPKNPQALNNLGILHYDRKEFEEAANLRDRIKGLRQKLVGKP